MSNQNNILSTLNEIFKDVLENDSIDLNIDTTANDVPEWDSLSHIHLIVDIERSFKIKFTAGEIRNLKNIGELVNMIEAKQK